MGFISNLRVVVGTALYDSATYIPPSAPLTNVTGTKLLCCQSNGDAAHYAVSPGAITATGNVVSSLFNPIDTNIGVARGMESNYCTWNQNYKRAGAFIFDSNCAFWHYETYGWKSCVGNIAVGGSGKWYFEVKKTSANGAAGGYSMTQFREDPRMNHSHYSYTESNELVCFHYGNCEVKYENTDIIQ